MKKMMFAALLLLPVTAHGQFVQYTATYSITPQPVTGGTLFQITVTLSSPAGNGLVVDIAARPPNRVSNHPNTLTFFPAGTTTFTYGMFAGIVAQPTTITCHPNYWYFFNTNIPQTPLPTYNIEIVPPELNVAVGNPLPNNTVHVDVTLSPPNVLPVGFDLLSSAPTVINNRLSQVMQPGGIASFNLPIFNATTVDSVTLTARITIFPSGSGALQASGTVVLANRYELISGTGIGPGDPTSVTKPVSGVVPATYPLRSTSSCSLLKTKRTGPKHRFKARSRSAMRQSHPRLQVRRFSRTLSLSHTTARR